MSEMSRAVRQMELLLGRDCSRTVEHGRRYVSRRRRGPMGPNAKRIYYWSDREEVKIVSVGEDYRD